MTSERGSSVNVIGIIFDVLEGLIKSPNCKRGNSVHKLLHAYLVDERMQNFALGHVDDPLIYIYHHHHHHHHYYYYYYYYHYYYYYYYYYCYYYNKYGKFKK